MAGIEFALDVSVFGMTLPTELGQKVLATVVVANQKACRKRKTRQLCGQPLIGSGFSGVGQISRNDAKVDVCMMFCQLTQAIRHKSCVVGGLVRTCGITEMKISQVYETHMLLALKYRQARRPANAMVKNYHDLTGLAPPSRKCFPRRSIESGSNTFQGEQQ